MDLSLKEQFNELPYTGNRAIRWRQPVSIGVVLLCGLILIATPPLWSPLRLGWHVFDSLGLILIVLAAFGRIWSSLYISGYKEDRVVMEGPYAIVRNPLYVFSFIGSLGIGMVTQHLVILSMIVLAFLLYYPLVVQGEERILEQKFGPVYCAYRQKVPRFLPRRFPLVEPDTSPVRLRHVRRSMQEIMCFFWAYLIIRWVAEIQYAGWFNGFFSS